MINQATKLTLQSLFDSMDKAELDQALKLLLDESLIRDWEEIFGAVDEDANREMIGDKVDFELGPIGNK